MEKLKHNEVNEKENIIENFFKLWIAKIFMNDDKYKAFYHEILDENNKFNINKFSNFIDFIYKNISEKDITKIRPNNIEENIDKEKINKIILWTIINWDSEFASDLYTFLEINKKPNYETKYESQNFNNDIINWISDYLWWLYISISNKNKLTWENLNQIIKLVQEKVIEAINSK